MVSVCSFPYTHQSYLPPAVRSKPGTVVERQVWRLEPHEWHQGSAGGSASGISWFRFRVTMGTSAAPRLIESVQLKLGLSEIGLPLPPCAALAGPPDVRRKLSRAETSARAAVAPGHGVPDRLDCQGHSQIGLQTCECHGMHISRWCIWYDPAAWLDNVTLVMSLPFLRPRPAANRTMLKPISQQCWPRQTDADVIATRLHFADVVTRNE